MRENKGVSRLLTIGAVAVVVLFVVLPLLLVPALSAFGCDQDGGAESGADDSGAGPAVVNSSYTPPEHSDDPVAEKMATFMEGVAVDDSHGYSQLRRRGDPDYDCSSLVHFAAKSAGLDVPAYPFTTHTMGAVLMANGFQYFRWSGDYRNAPRELKRGDVVVNRVAHTELYAGGGLFVGARHAFPGGIDDGNPGDQGRGENQEIIISRYLDTGLVDVYRHDPNAQVSPAAGDSADAATTVKRCQAEPGPAGSPDVDPGDGTEASADQAKAIARKLVPAYFPDGDPDREFGCLVTIWTKESGWNLHAENPSSGAYGIPQSLPASKMASAGPDWKTNASTQIKWGLQYIKGRYQTPCGAWGRWQQQGWY